MTTTERIIKLCKEKNIPISKIEKDLGFGNGYLKSLKKGDIPYKRLELVSEYLEVGIDYLIFGSYLQFNSYGQGNEDITYLAEIQEQDPEYIHNLVEFVRGTYHEKNETT